MNKVLDGLKFGFGFFLVLIIIIISLGFAGWHTANQVTAGIFLGNFEFNGEVKFRGNNFGNFSLNQEIKTGQHWVNGEEIYRVTYKCPILGNNMAIFCPIPNFNSSYIYWIDTSNSFYRRTDNGDIIMSSAASPISVSYDIVAWINFPSGRVEVVTGMDRTYMDDNYMTLNYVK